MRRRHQIGPDGVEPPELTGYDARAWQARVDLAEYDPHGRDSGWKRVTYWRAHRAQRLWLNARWDWHQDRGWPVPGFDHLELLREVRAVRHALLSASDN